MMPTCFPRSGANFSASSTSRPDCTRPARLEEPADLCAERLVLRCASAGEQRNVPRENSEQTATSKQRRKAGAERGKIPPRTFSWNDILERPAGNRVVALSCVCYQQKKQGASGRIQFAETRCGVPASAADPVPYDDKNAKSKPKCRGEACAGHVRREDRQVESAATA